MHPGDGDTRRTAQEKGERRLVRAMEAERGVDGGEEEA